MCSGETFVWGLIGIVFGPPMVKWPYKLTRWQEMWDAIGRKPSGRVEPAEWNVALTRIVGIVLSVVGVSFLVSCLGLRMLAG
jgi:hypothetical protein